MQKGYLALILHAHLPYVRHPEYEDSLEENWLYEATTETYIPVFLILEKLIEDGVDFRLTLSVTPSLTSMLLDPFLQSRYLRRLERLIELAEKEVARTESEPEFHTLALMYHRLFVHTRETYVRRYNQDLIKALKRFQESGKVEILASAATHGYLPLLSVDETAVRAQIRVGIEHYQRVFDTSPKGFWLPECGYYPGLDRLLREFGIRYTILETHGITRASERPKYGVYAPIYCPSGVAVFGREPESSRQVWSSIVGYPGDPDYREFYRDIGYDLGLDYIKPYIHPDGIRIDTGIKYYRITGKGDDKDVYRPERAKEKAEIHAGHFLSERIRQAEHLSAAMDRNPIFVAPYDAELFGHWWFEGPVWLDHLIRKIASEQDTIRLTVPSEYLEAYPVNQTATPSLSSWGHKGFSEVWLNPQNDWLYPHLHMAAGFLEKIAQNHSDATGLALRALNQAARELLLAQASDWAFMINSGGMKEYAVNRTKSHLIRAHRLGRQIQGGKIDESWLSKIENQDNIFPEIATAVEFMRQPSAAKSANLPGHRKPGLEPEKTAPLPSSLHIVMVSPEIAPLAKTGELADVVGSLALALERLGQKVSLIMPAYRTILQKGLPIDDMGIPISVTVSDSAKEGALLRTKLGNDVSAYLIRADHYFDRDYLYGNPDYVDNAERFVFFSRAALEVLRRIEPAHIFHAYDWQSALAVTFLRAQPELYPELPAVRSVFTFHDLKYQGVFWHLDWHLLNLDWDLFNARHLEYYGKINFLKGGVSFADAVTTVSPTYAQEIRSPEQGFGLDGFFQTRANCLAGILHGVDYSLWNPASDPFIVKTYGPEDLSGKQLCKADLQRQFGLPQEPGIPLLAMVSRMVDEKGFDLLQEVLDDLLGRELQFVLLGTGQEQYQELFRTLPGLYPGKVGVRIASDESLAHKIEAGADFFLMPSRYEPGGLSQLYSLTYGTIPIVHSTGGLKDSVQEFDPATAKGNGFVFELYKGQALLDTVDRALLCYRHKDGWPTLVSNAMRADCSSVRSAGEYLKLYRKLLGG